MSVLSFSWYVHLLCIMVLSGAFVHIRKESKGYSDEKPRPRVQYGEAGCVQEYQWSVHPHIESERSMWF